MTSRATISAIRFGYGLPLPAAAPVAPEAMLAMLAGPDRVAARLPMPGFGAILPDISEYDELRAALRGDGAGARAALRAKRQQIDARALWGARRVFARAVDSEDGFRERLVQFWADHFTVRGRRVRDRAGPSAFVEDAIRPHVAGRFGDMLRAAVLHPVMLVYLDQVSSLGPNSVAGRRRGRGLNENLAREVLELHTLGVGAGYGQADVGQFAELLTGLGVSAGEGFVFRKNWAEPGAEVLLGVSYGGGAPGLADIERALDDLARRPETAVHVARKLAVHFVADAPDEALVARLADVFRESGGDLPAVYAALLAHPAAWAAPGAKARQPFDFIVAALRALGVGAGEIEAMGDKPFRRLILSPMQAMGQAWQAPRGPDGWPEAAGAWISPQGLAARIQWAMQAPQRLRATLPDPRGFLAGALGDAAGPGLVRAAARAESAREGVGLVLASPEFNRR